MSDRNFRPGNPDFQWRVFPSVRQVSINGRVFLASVCSGLLTHLYCMVNLVGNEDTITSYTESSTHIASSFQSADTGRWLSGAVNWLQGWYRTPMVSGVLIILILALLAQVLIRLLPIRSKAGMYLAAVFLEVSSPAQAYVSLHEVGYPLSALLAVLGVWFLRRDESGSALRLAGTGEADDRPDAGRAGGASSSGKAARRETRGRGRLLRSWLPAFLCESVSLVILPVNASCAAAVILMLLVSDVLSDDDLSLRRQWRWTAECLLVLACSGAFLLLSSKGIMAALGMSSTSYQGAEQAMSGGFLSSLLPNYLHAFVKLFIIGVWKIQTLPALRFAYYLCYLLDAVCAVLLLRHCGDPAGRKAIRVLHLLLYLLLLPAAVCSISLVSYGFMYRGQHRMALILFLCGTILLVEETVSRLQAGRTEGAAVHSNAAVSSQGMGTEAAAEAGRQQEDGAGAPGRTAGRLERGRTAGRLDPGRTAGRLERGLFYVMAGAFCLMIYAGFLFDNIGYVNQHHVMLHDGTLCTRILTQLDSTEGFSYDQPVYFLNILSTDGEEAVSPLRLDPELDSVIWPVSTTDLYAYGDSSLRYHMQTYEGVIFQSPSKEEAEKIENSGLKEEYQTLPPYAFHIERMDGVWVVVVKTVMPPSVAYG